MHQYANHIGWSDVNPYEVVRVVSAKTLEVRPMATERDPSGPALIFVPGGFCGTFINQSEQRWIITPDPNGKVIRIRLGKRGWRAATGEKFELADHPLKYYDYNF